MQYILRNIQNGSAVNDKGENISDQEALAKFSFNSYRAAEAAKVYLIKYHNVITIIK